MSQHPGHRLWRTYALSVALLVTLVLMVSGLAQIWLIQRETRIAVEAQQALEATKASARIELFIGEIGALVRSSLSLLDSGHVSASESDILIELYRLMKQSSAIQELYWMDHAGRERLRIARMAPDRIGMQADRSKSPEFLNARLERPWFGQAVFVVNQPRVVMAQRGQRPQSGVIAAQIDLTQLRDIISETRFGREGVAYIVDRDGSLLAHPDLHHVLARPDWTSRLPVRSVMAATTADHLPGGGALMEFESPGGRPMVARAAELTVPGWRLITEQPRDEAYAPVQRAMTTTLLILILAILAGSVVGIVMARRVVRPIQQLADGADHIGEGRLDYRIDLIRNDELGQLAARFNQMAERLSDSYQQLEAKVDERTRELLQANAVLRIKHEEAEQASQAKTRFLASASHDLRQPLHTISLLVGVLSRQPVAPEIGKLVHHIHESVSAMDALFGSLLDISELDAGIAKPVLGDHALAEILQRVAGNYVPEAARKRLRLVVVPSRYAVRTDAALLERVLGNLISNAIRYTEKGKVLVGCRRRQGGAELQVWDTGVGISPADQSNIFDEFFQIDNPERDRSKGLGLGLSIVKRTLELLQHPYSLCSEPGRGTCFSILLPFAESLVLPASPSEVMGGQLIAGAFIVVVDDEADTRFAMQALCLSWGAHVLVAASAEQCLELLEEHLRSPDLILCDYRLRQHQDGLAAIEQIRARIGLKVPALIVTGDISAADLRRVADAGLPQLHKPVGAQRLLEAIEAALETHPIGGSGATGMDSDLQDEDTAGR